MMKQLVKWNLLIWLLAMTMVIPSFAAGKGPGTAQGAVPHLLVDSVPEKGEKGTISGRVLINSAELPGAKPSDYRISVFLQVTEGGTMWPKPYYNQTYTELNDDFSFNAVFITGGYDIDAEKLHVMLVPGDYVPVTFSQTKADALAYVEITRKSGGVTAEPSEETVLNAFAAETAASSAKLSVCAGFYLKGKQPGDSISREEMKLMLDTAAPYIGMLRFYSCTGPLDNAYKLSKEKGIRVIGTAWLSGDETADRAELDAMVKLANSGYMEICCVGSETLNRGDLTEDELLSAMAYVRGRLTAAVPVTTADTADMLLKHPRVIQACDIIFANIHPIFAGIKEESLLSYVDSYVKKLQAAQPGKQVWLSETGYPTKKTENGKTVDCSATAAKFVEQLKNYSAETGTPCLLFELFDERWKGTGTAYSVIEQNWGLFDENLKIKDCYRTLFEKAAGKTGTQAAK